MIIEIENMDDLVNFTMNHSLTPKEQLTNGVIGLVAEAGEAADLVKKHLFQGHDLDKGKLKKELADVLWYYVLVCRTLGVTLEDITQAAIQKLMTRYPNGFSSESSQARKDVSGGS